jgi:hypothetical protein
MYSFIPHIAEMFEKAQLIVSLTCSSVIIFQMKWTTNIKLEKRLSKIIGKDSPLINV